MHVAYQPVCVPQSSPRRRPEVSPVAWRSSRCWRALGWLSLSCWLVAGSAAPVAAQEAEATVAEGTPAVINAAEVPEQLRALLQAGVAGRTGGNAEFQKFDEVIKDAEKIDGLFTLYRKKSKLFAEIKPSQFSQMYLVPIAIARGLASAGVPLNFGDEWVISFKRDDKRLQVIRKNIYYEASDGPLKKAVEQNYTDSIIAAVPIVTINPATQGVLIDLGDIFHQDFANLGLGSLARDRTTWHKVKAFANNVELQVECTFQGRVATRRSGGESGVVDPRGTTVVLHYSITKRPDPGYRPRYADYRVGHFISATRDFGSTDPTTTFRRRINRWRLEKANPKAELSPPKQQIVWWVENTVPHEFRPYVEEGILEWNRAFEKIGYRNALGVRWQNDQDEFDPEDINYCTFRWITTPSTYAMSGLRADPITGEMIDGDVIFDASWIRVWKTEYALLMGVPVTTATGAAEEPSLLAVGEVISPMMAAQRGYGLPIPMAARIRLEQEQASRGAGDQPAVQLVPSTMSPIQMELSRRVTQGNMTSCQCASSKQHEYALAVMALAAAAQDKDQDGKPNVKDLELPEEFIGQAIKEVVMHEVGHSLGLRHNFRASAIRSLEDINNPEISRSQGMVGSVMDYNPLNIVRPGEKQGDFAATTLGPYDYWAIEYAYKEIQGNEADELKKIAARSPAPELAYATDEDLYLSNDPLVNTYDLGNDPLAYARDRLTLARELVKNLDETVVREGDSWARLRNGFSVLLSQFGNAAYVASRYVGGQHIARDYKGGEQSRDPVTPVEFNKQREALDFLVSEILDDGRYEFSPRLLRRLTTENWSHWGSDGLLGGSDFDVYQRILAIQRIAISQVLDPGVLKRIQNQALLADENQQPLTISEAMRKLTDGVWGNLNGEAGQPLSSSVTRRNLQREHLNRLMSMVLGDRRGGLDADYVFVVLTSGSGSYPADARSLARAHLAELDQKIGGCLDRPQVEETTRAHLEECRQLVRKTLAAQVSLSQP